MHGVSSNSPLPPSVETAYYRKCIELKRRLTEIETDNDTLRIKKDRIERSVLKMRIERAMLLEHIAQRMRENPDDSDDSNSPPPTVSAPTYRLRLANPNANANASASAPQLNGMVSADKEGQPQDRPLRSKRAHGRKGTPTPGGGGGGMQQSSPLAGGAGLHSVYPGETPDALRVREYMPTQSNEVTPAPPINGGVLLPSLSAALPASLQPQSAPSGFAAINNPAPERNGDTEMREDER